MDSTAVQVVDSILSELLGDVVRKVRGATEKNGDGDEKSGSALNAAIMEDRMEPGADNSNLYVHRSYEEEEEAVLEDDVVVGDEDQEHLEELEHEVSALQECLEVAEAHVDKVEAELLMEKSKVELIEKELEAKERMVGLALAEKSRQLQEALARAEF